MRLIVGVPLVLSPQVAAKPAVGLPGIFSNESYPSFGCFALQSAGVVPLHRRNARVKALARA